MFYFFFYLHEHLLLLELLGDVLGGGAGHLDPRLGEERARREHEGQVEDGVQRVCRHVRQRRGGGQIVHQTAHGDQLPAGGVLRLLPSANACAPDTVSVARTAHLTIRGKRPLPSTLSH
eukprot:1184852-Prorocentrum_minimum.AAC.2